MFRAALGKLNRARRWFLAYYRLDKTAVCEMSQGRLPHADFHDYPDSTVGAPLHMFLHTCRRCGKKFTI